MHIASTVRGFHCSGKKIRLKEEINVYVLAAEDSYTAEQHLLIHYCHLIATERQQGHFLIEMFCQKCTESYMFLFLFFSASFSQIVLVKMGRSEN